MRRLTPPLTITSFNLTSRYAHTSDGDVVPITKMYNHLGDETDSVTDARSFIATDGVIWLTGQCNAFRIVPEIPPERQAAKPLVSGLDAEARKWSQRRGIEPAT